MNIKDVRYSPLLQTNALGEQLDDLTRYLRLCGEFGCTAEGEAVFRRGHRCATRRRPITSLAKSAT